MADESIIGLLLRAHAKCSEQKHGEEYVFRNIPSSQCYEQAVSFIESAIKEIVIAERYAVKDEKGAKP
jgi:hypothetical protein